MIIVTVELLSAVTGTRTKLKEMRIANEGTGSVTKGNYHCRMLDSRRECRIVDYPRMAVSVWNLVQRALTTMGYTK